MALVYVHQCPNGKLYIGMTTKEHIGRWGYNGIGYKYQPLFWRAIQKYGWDNINHIILIDNISTEMACECEEYLIAKYQSNNPKYGYNVASGGRINHGYHLTEEHKQKLSISHKEFIRMNGSPTKGIKRTEETKRKISDSKKGTKQSKETCQKRSESLKGHSVSIETRKKISDGHKGKKWSEESKKKFSEQCKGRNKGCRSPMKGKHHTEEAKERIRQANLGRPKSEETIRKLREAAIGKHTGKRKPMSEETKRKISESNKGKRHGGKHKIKLSIKIEVMDK